MVIKLPESMLLVQIALLAAVASAAGPGLFAGRALQEADRLVSCEYDHNRGVFPTVAER